MDIPSEVFGPGDDVKHVTVRKLLQCTVYVLTNWWILHVRTSCMYIYMCMCTFIVNFTLALEQYV